MAVEAGGGGYRFVEDADVLVVIHSVPQMTVQVFLTLVPRIALIPAQPDDDLIHMARGEQRGKTSHRFQSPQTMNPRQVRVKVVPATRFRFYG